LKRKVGTPYSGVEQHAVAANQPDALAQVDALR
jgi:predicted acyl esterase